MTKLVRFIIVSVQLMFFFFSAFSLTISYAAEPRPAWQSEWDKTVKAAEEEGASGYLHDPGLRAGISRHLSEEVSKDQS